MKKKFKNQEGITLIALIITIIVMLILVAVTINMAINGGLFNYAGKAVGDTQNAIDEEKMLAEGKIKIDGKWYDSIDDYLSGKGRIYINYDYDKTERIENTTIKLKFTIGGLQTFEEFSKNFLKGKTETELEAILGYWCQGGFEGYLEGKNTTSDEMRNTAEAQEKTYEEYLKIRIMEDNPRLIEGKYFLQLVGLENLENNEIDELEELFIKSINYQGTFEEFLSENEITRDTLTQFATAYGATYKQYLELTILSENTKDAGLDVTLPNGEKVKISYIDNLTEDFQLDLKTEFIVTENTTYTVTATGANGEYGETAITISNLYDEIFSEIYEETAEFVDSSGKKAIIPKGFAVGISDEISSIDTGLVITDAVDSNGHSIGNEFVWIPLSENLDKSYNYTWEYSSDYIEPKAIDSDIYSESGEPYDSQGTLDYLYGENYYNYANQFKYEDEYIEMVNKVNNYKGFYIGRYEITIDNSGKIGSKGNTTVLTSESILKEGSNPQNGEPYYYRWYGLYNASKNADIVGNGEYLQTAMIYGVLWDETMDFIRTQKKAGKTDYDVDVPHKGWDYRKKCI